MYVININIVMSNIKLKEIEIIKWLNKISKIII